MNDASTSAEPAIAATLAHRAEPKMLAIEDRFDPLALSGTANPRFAERLAYQVATCQWLPSEFAAQEHAEPATSAIAGWKDWAPAKAGEARRATEVAPAHTATPHPRHRARAPPRRERAGGEPPRQYARLSEVFLKQLDRFVRQRGRQLQ